MDLTRDRIRKDISAWVSFEGLFEVKIKYMPRDELRKALKRCTRTVFVKHQKQEEIDETCLIGVLSDLIEDWGKELTYEMIDRHLVPIVVERDRIKEAVPCTQQNKEFLLRYAYGFDVFVQETAMDLDALVAREKEAERKNSKPTSGGSLPPDASPASNVKRSTTS